MRKCLVTSFALVLLAANAAWADVVVHNPFDPVSVFLVFVLEAGLAAHLADPLGLRPRRVFVAWLATTLVTFALFVKFTSSVKSLPFISKVIIGEFWVIMIEGFALYLMSHSLYFRRDRSGRLGAAQAVKTSVVANIASILMGLFLTGPHIFGANRSVRLFQVDVLGSVGAVWSTAGPVWAEILADGPIHFQTAVGVLAFEALLAAILLCLMGFEPLRVFIVWLLISSATFTFFVKFIAYLQEIPFIQRVIAAAACVVVLEALALYVMGLVPFLRHGRSGRLPATKTLAVSAFVNVGSMLTSLWMVSLFIFLSFMM